MSCVAGSVIVMVAKSLLVLLGNNGLESLLDVRGFVKCVFEYICP